MNTVRGSKYVIRVNTKISWARFICPCKQCGAGRYATAAGSRSCSKCAPGKYQDKSGRFLYDCPIGKYQGDEEGQSCDSCLAGKYASGSGSTSCASCPSGKPLGMAWVSVHASKY